MVLNNNKMILIFGFSEEELLYLEKSFKELQLPKLKAIEKNMAGMRLKDIIDGLMLDTYDKVLPDEKVVIFNNFTDEELDKCIKK